MISKHHYNKFNVFMLIVIGLIIPFTLSFGVFNFCGVVMSCTVRYIIYTSLSVIAICVFSCLEYHFWLYRKED